MSTKMRFEEIVTRNPKLQKNKKYEKICNGIGKYQV